MFSTLSPTISRYHPTKVTTSRSVGELARSTKARRIVVAVRRVEHDKNMAAGHGETTDTDNKTITQRNNVVVVEGTNDTSKGGVVAAVGGLTQNRSKTIDIVETVDVNNMDIRVVRVAATNGTDRNVVVTAAVDRT